MKQKSPFTQSERETRFIALFLVAIVVILSSLGAGKALAFFLFLPSGEGMGWFPVFALATGFALAMGVMFSNVAFSKR